MNRFEFNRHMLLKSATTLAAYGAVGGMSLGGADFPQGALQSPQKKTARQATR